MPDLTPERLAELRRILEGAPQYESPYTAGLDEPAFANNNPDPTLIWIEATHVASVNSKWISEQKRVAIARLLVAAVNALPSLLSSAERLVEVERERDEARQRLLTAAGDDLCRLSQDEIKAMSAGEVKIPPKEEFLASCERFHAQVAGEAGVMGNCLTLAQLIAENERQRQSLEEAREQLAAAKEENAELHQFVPHPESMSGFDDPNAPDDVKELIALAEKYQAASTI